MKATDSSIKVGAALTSPGAWPDGQVATKYGDTADWNTTVLKTDGSKIDFVIIHYYPNSKTESEMLSQYQNIAMLVSQTRAAINEYAGSNAPNIQIMVTETDATLEDASVPSALFAADTYMTFLQNGVERVDWWDLHNGPGSTPVTKLADGVTDYGDQGIRAP